MAIAKKLSSDVTPNQNHHYLNAWPDMLMEDIWHFNQCAGDGAPVQTTNDKGGIAYTQPEREYIARNLNTAAGRMGENLNYWINPAYFYQDVYLSNTKPFQRQIFRMRWLKMIELGRRATSLIQADVTVSYSDPDEIGVDTLATITLNSTLPVDQIKLYFRSEDGAADDGDYRYEVEPVAVKSSGGMVTITGHRALFVKPSEWQQTYIKSDPNLNHQNVVNTQDANQFVTLVDVYRVYTDAAANLELFSPNGTLLQSYVGEIIDPLVSAVRIGNLCQSYCGGLPYMIRVYYKAGAQLNNGNIDSELFEACCALASARMESKLSKMSYWSLDQWVKWHDPMVEKMGNSAVAIATKSEAAAGFGARTGEVLAWSTCMDRRLEVGNKFF